MDFDKPPDATTALLIGLGGFVLLAMCCCVSAVAAPFFGLFGQWKGLKR